MYTEKEAWIALVKRANELGKQGKSVRNIAILEPQTATQGYMGFIEGYYPEVTSGD